MNMLTNDSQQETAASTAVPTNVQILEVLQQSVLGADVLCDKLRTLFQGQVSSLQTLEQMEQEVFETNEANGWFEADRSVGDDVALLHSEVTEMFEAFRDNHGTQDATKVAIVDPDKLAELSGGVVEGGPVKPEGFGSECADVLIRLLDTSRRWGIDLRAEYVRKIAFNKTRGYRHGGKAI